MVILFLESVVMKEIREILAKMVYEKDFDLGTTTVKELIDFLMEVGRTCGEAGFDVGRDPAIDKEKWLNKCFSKTKP